MNEMKFDKGLMAGSSTLLVLSLLESGDMYAQKYSVPSSAKQKRTESVWKKHWRKRIWKTSRQ